MHHVKYTIYVQLLNEGVKVFRPVSAVLIAEDLYKIENEGYVCEVEEWEFVPGTIVKVALRELSEGAVLIAKEKVV
jgi:hypothetical protein